MIDEDNGSPRISRPGLPVTGQLDDQQRRFAAQVQQDHPDWVVMWGYHSRLYWAFPRFNAPRGTLAAAPEPAELTESMRRAEIAAAQAPRIGPAPLAGPRRLEPLPRQPPPGLAAAGAPVAAEKRPAAGHLGEPEASVG
jgi:hypothetical protein